MLEAPVTGGLEALLKRQMTVLIAGERDLADELHPFLSHMFANVIYTGKVGTAQIPKVLSNMLCSVHNQAMGEVLMMGKKAGVDAKTMFDCIRASSGSSFVWETAAPMLLKGTYDPTFSIDLMIKDGKIGSQIAEEHGIPIEILKVAHEAEVKAMEDYGKDASCYIAVKRIEDAMGEELRDEEFKDWYYSIENVDGSSCIRHHGIDIKRTGQPVPE